MLKNILIYCILKTEVTLNMDNNNIYFSKGIRYAIKETYANVHGIKNQLKNVQNEFGKEASDEFLKGYYDGLKFFTHAIEYVDCGNKRINERSEIIGKEYGEENKNTFLMGISYYEQIEKEKESNFKK